MLEFSVADIQICGVFRVPRSKFPANSRPVLVGIAGGSGAGKSWMAERLRAKAGGQTVHFSLDDFYLDRAHLPTAKRARLNFDHPRAVDWRAFEHALRALKSGGSARIPVYNFSTHCCDPSPRVLHPKPIVVVDGLWLFWRLGVRRLFDLRVFVDCPTSIRLQRRLDRDMKSRGRTAESVRLQFRTSVQPMHKRFVAPQKKWADFACLKGGTEMDVKRIAEAVRALLASRSTKRVKAG